jgi:hypothetical protein
MSFRSVLRRAGFALPALGRSLWVIAPDAAEVERAYKLLDAVLERRPGYLMVLSLPLGRDAERLIRLYEREVVLPLPLGLAAARYGERINPALAVLLGRASPWRSRWQKRLAALNFPLTILDPADDAAMEHLAGLLPRLAPTRELRESLRRPSPLARLALGSIGRRWTAQFARRQIHDWDSLAQCLGQPQRILCLGNGPSSEDIDLQAYAGDTLFRVNWRWRQRGQLVSPQLVFVGDPRTPSRLAVPIYGFRSREEANYVLWRQRFRLRPQPFRFFVFDEMPGAGSQAWPARPTNGAIMVATAAALRPQRLVIAGIDLYSHPAGRYPGGSDAHDGYNRVHDRDVEIEMIRQALAGFAGEVRVLSPILAAALAAGDGISRGGRVPS